MKTILLIDDDPDIVKSMKVVLDSKGYNTASANSAKEGIEILKTVNPDLIILDVMMETVSAGFNLSREIKNNESTKNVPIIMLTAIKEKMGLDFNKESGDETWLPVNDFCEKPLNPDELINKVEKYIGKAN